MARPGLVCLRQTSQHQTVKSPDAVFVRRFPVEKPLGQRQRLPSNERGVQKVECLAGNRGDLPRPVTSV